MTDVGFGGNVGTAFFGFASLRSDGIGLPTGRAMFNGSTACLITAIGGYVGGRDASRTISLQLGSASTSSFTVPNDAHPVNFTGYISTNNWLVNGGSASFYIYMNNQIVNFGRSSTSGATNVYGNQGSTWSGTLGGAYRYVQAPSAPQSLTATTPTGTPTGRVSLSWSAPADNGGTSVTGYNVYTSAGTFVDTTTGTTLTVTGLTPGTSNSFVVRALNAVTTAAGTQSVNSNTATATASGIPTAPGTPTGTSGVDAFGKVVLSWTAPSESYGTITGYRIYGTTGGVETLVATTTGTGTTNIAVTGLTQRANYTFRVAARNAYTDGASTEGTRSASSASIQASGPPTAPTGLTAAVPVPEAAQSLVLNWTAPSNDGDPSGGITGYQIFYSTGVLIASINGTGTTYTVTGLIPGQEYGFYVQARNAISDAVGTHSANSNVAYATPIGAPDQVTGLSATPVSSTKGAVLLMWDEDPFADGYLVYRNTTPTLTLLQRVPGAGNNIYVHYLDRTLTSYSSQSYVVSAYNEFAPDGGPVSASASATPNVTVLQATVATATPNLTNQNVYSGDFPIVSLTADTFTYARTASNLTETSVPATFGTVNNLTNDDISGTYTISVTGAETPFFSYTKVPDVGVGDIPSETVAASSTAVNNTNAIFNGAFTVASLDGTDGIVYSVTGTNPTIDPAVAATGTIVNQSNTTFNVTTQIADVTSSTLSFPVPGAADEATSAAEGIVTDTTNRDVFNDDEAAVYSAPAHNVLVYELPGAPEASGVSPYIYSNSTGTGASGITAVTRTNLSPNPAAVSTSSFGGLLGTLSAITDFPTYTNAVRFTRTSAGAARFSQTIGTNFLASTQYTLVMQVRASEQLTDVGVHFRHSITVPAVITTLTIPAGLSEIRVTGTRSSTAPESTAAWALLWSTGALNSTLDVTRIQLIQGSTPGLYFDGGTPGTSDITYSWSGTANASTSLETATNYGGLRFNSTTVGEVTTLRIDNLDRNVVAQNGWYTTWDDYAGSEPIRGIVSINTGAPEPLLLSVSGTVAASTGHYVVPVQYISGSLPSNSTIVSLSFIPYVSTEVLSPYGAVRKANSTAKLEIRYRSGWLA